MKFNFNKLISKTNCNLAVLVDPDKFDAELISLLNYSNTAFILVGGSKLKKGKTNATVKAIKKLSKLPVILFPGDESQLCKEADGVLVLSLLSGRNTEYLIEKHVRAAQQIKQQKLATFPVAYILIESGSKSQTQKVTKTTPLSNHQTIINTALAAEQLGFKAVYLEAGSGSAKQVNTKLVKKVADSISIPIFVGGGINSSKAALAIKKSHANVVVVGNALEKNRDFIHELSKVFVY